MITFSRIGTMGRLGNQLFQYAALKSLALHNRYEACLPPVADKVWHSQECLLTQLNIPDKFEDCGSKCKYDEPASYSAAFFGTQDNVDLDGYFQDVRYFERFLPEIKNYVSLNKATAAFTNAGSYRQLIEPQRKHSSIVSLHLRLGDNIFMSPQKDTCEAIMMGYPMQNYLKNAIDHFGDVDYFVFYGGSRNTKEGYDDRDFVAAKQILSSFDRDFIFSSGNGTLEDFQLMQDCDASILSPFTTFGLWVGYLAAANKQIAAPVDYFMGSEPQYAHRKMYLDHWIRM